MTGHGCPQPPRNSPALSLLVTALALFTLSLRTSGAQANVDELRRAADQGSASAQFDLGVIYDFGTGVAQDYAQALRWYRKAAEQGFADAQFNLGAMYAKGAGVDRDDTAAAQGYRKAAEQGDARAQFNPGSTYATNKA